MSKKKKKASSQWSILNQSMGRITKSRMDKSSLSRTVKGTRLVSGKGKSEKAWGKSFVYFKGASLSKSGGKLPRLSARKSSYGKSLLRVGAGKLRFGVLLRLPEPPPLDIRPPSLDDPLPSQLRQSWQEARNVFRTDAEFAHAQIDVLAEEYIEAKISGDEQRAEAIRQRILELQDQADPLEAAYWQRLRDTIRREIITPIALRVHDLRDSEPGLLARIGAPFSNLWHQIYDPAAARVEELRTAERERRWGPFRTEEGRSLIAQWLRLKRRLGLQ